MTSTARIPGLGQSQRRYGGAWRRRLPVGAVLLLLCQAALAGCSDDDGQGADAAVDAGLPDAAPPDAEVHLFPFPARVLRIIDGDTVEVRVQDQEVAVRFLGVNCPELSPSPEPWAEEAKQFSAQHALPTYDVGLEFDDESCASVPFPQGCLDYYGRLLAYVRTAEDEDLGALLLASGLARVYTLSTCGRQDAYLQIQAQAQAEGVGIWSQ
ncbi:MAG: thermonuclease family protein [Polyangia bacterium]|jgi:micrococcal nuclease|nr:thermonuclease family protein [Polyangia bacterium]